jgi:hypothetical protein
MWVDDVLVPPHKRFKSPLIAKNNDSGTQPSLYLEF